MTVAARKYVDITQWANLKVGSKVLVTISLAYVKATYKLSVDEVGEDEAKVTILEREGKEFISEKTNYNKTKLYKGVTKYKQYRKIENKIYFDTCHFPILNLEFLTISKPMHWLAISRKNRTKEVVHQEFDTRQQATEHLEKLFDVKFSPFSAVIRVSYYGIIEVVSCDCQDGKHLEELKSSGVIK